VSDVSDEDATWMSGVSASMSRRSYEDATRKLLPWNRSRTRRESCTMIADLELVGGLLSVDGEAE